jgi:CheY-like chemotaxis protein
MERKHVLIVDDQREMLLLLSSALEALSYDFKISIARSGEEALLEASMNSVDLLICDILLPGMDGFEVMENFKKNHPNSKIVLISGTQDDSIKKEIAQAGATAFFFKPIVLSDFQDTIERALGLVETILPNEIETFKKEFEEDENPTKPPLLISDLHSQIEADCILLINYQGHVASIVGSLSEEFKQINRNPDILTMLYNPIPIAQSFRSKLHNNFTSIQINQKFIGLSAITTNYGLLTVCNNQPSDKNIQIIFETLDKLRQQLSLNTDILSSILINDEQKIHTADLYDARMEETLSSPKIQTDQLTDFWESAVEETSIKSNDESLSYEQAKILGFTPDK